MSGELAVALRLEYLSHSSFGTDSVYLMVVIRSCLESYQEFVPFVSVTSSDELALSTTVLTFTKALLFESCILMTPNIILYSLKSVYQLWKLCSLHKPWWWLGANDNSYMLGQKRYRTICQIPSCLGYVGHLSFNTFHVIRR